MVLLYSNLIVSVVVLLLIATREESPEKLQK